MICRNCGKSFSENAALCPACGTGKNDGGGGTSVPTGVLIGGGIIFVVMFGSMIFLALQMSKDHSQIGGAARGEESSFVNKFSNQLINHSVLVPYVPGSGKDTGWLISYDQAMTLAKEKNRPVLLDFTGSDWCVLCKKLKKEVFDTADFKSWAAANVVLLEVDFPKSKQQSHAARKQNRALKNKYLFFFKGYPTILFLDAGGNVLGKSGYLKGGLEPWLSQAKMIVKKK